MERRCDYQAKTARKGANGTRPTVWYCRADPNNRTEKPNGLACPVELRNKCAQLYSRGAINNIRSGTPPIGLDGANSPHAGTDLGTHYEDIRDN